MASTTRAKGALQWVQAAGARPRRAGGRCGRGALPRISATPEDGDAGASGSEKKKGFLDLTFGEELLDFMEAGPKMRKWYGAPEKGTDVLDLSAKRPETKEGGERLEGDDSEGDDSERDAVLVVDANGKLGEEVVLQLILKRVKVKALVRSEEDASNSFGEYATCVESSLDDRTSLRRLLRGVKSLVVTGGMGFDKGERLMEACKSAGVEQVVLLSSYNNREGFLGGLFVSKEQSQLEDRERERIVAESGVPFSIIRAGDLADSSPSLQGGKLLEVSLGEKANRKLGGSLPRSELASASVACLAFGAKNLVVELAEGEGEGTPAADTFLVDVNSDEDWSLVFERR
ncbi:hypothetical protein HOP50_01g08940 [Chloropicon primus]|uniref:NAD(P)-binding domain-containing protein n=3 Tax=Chloropicon primus TaxID=1764295 RepID=A0A5B8MD52_9CHLO|nr:hypothetical protein A3770_01p09070 [Chloropicon primus]UPQ97599.1 hypothetical protein HOP50_01g08940 [Chloropicon primus]|eukprot:QDZ18389.1 hypothetical protein A3770_01p09070 [Chloropicon primus]